MAMLVYQRVHVSFSKQTGCQTWPGHCRSQNALKNPGGPILVKLLNVTHGGLKYIPLQATRLAGNLLLSGKCVSRQGPDMVIFPLGVCMTYTPSQKKQFETIKRGWAPKGSRIVGPNFQPSIWQGSMLVSGGKGSVVHTSWIHALKEPESMPSSEFGRQERLASLPAPV